MVSIKYVALGDKEFWFSLDAHLAESEFVKKVRDKQGYVIYDDGIPKGLLYMLMTVLKGSLAEKQSIALVRTFKKMKDYILENRELIGQREVLQLSMENILGSLD